MKEPGSIVLGMIAGVILSAGVPWIGPNDSALARSRTADMAAPTAAAPPTDEGAAAQMVQSTGGGDEVPPAGMGSESLAPAALPAPVPGETLVYFLPTDSNATATVLHLTNTDSADHTIALRGFSHDGALTLSQDIVVPAESFRRLVSDSVVASPPPSWITPAPIVTNFSDFTYFSSLSLPRGVQVEGYTLFNPGTGTIDPRADQGAVPLTFQAAPLLAPGVPQNLAASVAGGIVTITWAPPASGGIADSYILEAGSAPGLANLATVPVPTTTYAASGVPRGTYYLRVRAVNAIGTGAASAEVQLVVP